MSVSSMDLELVDDSDEGDDFDDDFEDDDGEYDFGDDEGGAAAPADDGEECEVEVLSPADIIATQADAIKEITEMFQIPPKTSRILLQHFKWDRERLIERYYGSGDIDKIFEEAHCVKPGDDDVAAAGAAVDGLVECPICMEDFAADRVTRLDCRCTVCTDCLTEYVTGEVLEYRAAIPCPSCDKLVDHTTLTELLQAIPGDTIPFRKYQAAVARLFVKGNRLVKFCPGVDCELAVRISSAASAHRPLPVRCTGGHEFCFACKEIPHSPVRCELYNRWRKKNEDDSETTNWMAANTKECPKCRSTIEKNGGCNHMKCNSCAHDFCWICLGPWAPHGSSWYNCNRYDDKESKDARDAEAQSRGELHRYLFYFNRYANHMQSLKLEGKLVALVEKMSTRIQESVGMSWIELQFLGKAVESLRRCRQVLMMTYVFAYYLRKTIESEIFESNQKDLEQATEILSGYLEQDLEQETVSHETIVELRKAVLDKASYCDQRREVLLEHVAEGSAKEAWEYQPEDIHKMMLGLPPL
mmetsp:Transcript_26066/g.68395  ORF Transcript_26066/g.68395 Transcript_26066/m.68395 type:complete len:528 (-) Transcript_26066:382-1965(-)